MKYETIYNTINGYVLAEMVNKTEINGLIVDNHSEIRKGKVVSAENLATDTNIIFVDYVPFENLVIIKEENIIATYEQDN